MGVWKTKTVRGKASRVGVQVVASLDAVDVPSGEIDAFLFLAEIDYRLISAAYKYTTPNTASLIYRLGRATGPQDPGSGTAMTTGVDMSQPAGVLYDDILSTTEANLILSAGHRLNFQLVSGTPAELAGFVFTILLLPLSDGFYKISDGVG